MLKKLNRILLQRLSRDWKTMLYCLILSIIGFLAFILVLHDLSN